MQIFTKRKKQTWNHIVSFELENCLRISFAFDSFLVSCYDASVVDNKLASWIIEKTQKLYETPRCNNVDVVCIFIESDDILAESFSLRARRDGKKMFSSTA